MTCPSDPFMHEGPGKHSGCGYRISSTSLGHLHVYKKEREEWRVIICCKLFEQEKYGYVK
jgi:hypothetical protein